MKNSFNQEIPKIKNIVRTEEKVTKYIKKTITQVLKKLEINNSKSIVDEILTLAQNNNSKEEIEKNTHNYLKEKGVTEEKIAEKLSNRAEIIYNQIKSHLKGKTLLDLGCGDGKVGELISKKDKYQVTLADIYEHNYIKKTKLPFVLHQENILLNEEFDTTLLITVLHHSINPLETLKEAKRLTKKRGRIIVLESVYGIKDESDFGQLNSEEQRLTSIFFDHFYNRIIHYEKDPKKKILIPFNHQTPHNWKKIFKKEGLNQINLIVLGIDQPLVPEFHTLHILEK